MKQLFFIIFLFFISCNTSNEVKEIEILTYFSNAKKFSVYSTIDKNGFTQSLFKKEESSYIDNCQSRIRKSLIDSIINVCRDKNDEDFIIKNPKKYIFDSYHHSVRITYENGKKIEFIFSSFNEENKQFIPFQSLSNQIQSDSLNSTHLEIGQYGNLKIKQEDLSNITIKKDSIQNAKYWKKRT